MRNLKSLILLIIFLHFCADAFAANVPTWQKQSAGILESKVKCLFVDPKGAFILAGTDKAIYRGHNHPYIFQTVLENHGNNPAINQIIQNSKLPSSLYSATDSGVFISVDDGKAWTNIFSPSAALARKVNSVLADAPAIYAGTGEGLYIQKNDQTWKIVEGDLGRKAVFSLAKDETYIYAATDSEIYRLEKNTEAIKKVYSRGDRYVDDETVTSDDDAVLQKQIKDMVISSDQKNLYFVAEQQIFQSVDHGENWKKLPSDSLPINLVHKLFVSGIDLYAATEKGIFKFTDDDWKSEGLSNIFSNDAAADKQGKLYLASNDGFYVLSSPIATKFPLSNANAVSSPQSKSLSSPQSLSGDPYLSNEPTINEVQRMAIEYANVDPQQIKRWHKQSRAKALLPKVSMGLSRSGTELYHWDAGPNPDNLLKGRDYMDWSTALSWDLGELVWSTDQTSIDSRSKLMSELRHDILDQVTRLYFERRRIQAELAAKDDVTMKSYISKQIQVEELTALIDGYTGGRFSSALKADQYTKN